MATGMLKFSPNNTVFIDLDLENHTANKAVDIDAEGVEWPLCGGGGGGDFQIFKATLTNVTQNNLNNIVFIFNDMRYKLPDIAAESTVEIWLPVIGSETILTDAAFTHITGDAEIDPDTLELVVTGDFTADVAEGLA